jgi:6-bladed beta-propeller protein
MRSCWLALFGVCAVSGAISAQALDLEAAPRREVSKALDLGAFDDPVLGFSRVSDVAVGRDGAVYVVQPMEGEVTVLSQSGELVRRVGRRGQGPGEFVSPGAIGWRGDELWILDVGSKRVSYFSGDELIDTHSYFAVVLGPRETLTSQMPLQAQRFLGILSRRPDRGRGTRDNSAPLIALDAQGKVVDTLGVLQESYPLRLQIGLTSTSPLFHDFPLFRVSRTGDAIVIVDRPFAEGSQNSIRLTKISARGDTVLTRDLTSPAIRLSDKMWRDRLALRESILENSTISTKEYLEASRRPRAIAGVSGMVLGRDGWVWLAREQMLGAPHRTWVALDSYGIPQFAVDLPSDLRLYHALPGEVWGVQPDEYDIPHVQRWVVETDGR